MKIRSHLLLLALGVIVPVLAFALAVAALLVRHEQEVFADATVARLRATMTAIDAQVHGHLTSLDALASLASLDERNFRRFHLQMGRILATQPGWLDMVLEAADGHAIGSTSIPYTDARGQPPILDRALARRVVDSGKPVIGGMGHVPAVGHKGVVIAVPVTRNGVVEFVLAAVVQPESFTPLIQAQRLGEGWVSGLVDAEGRFIARIPAASAEYASEGFRAAMSRSVESWYRGTSVEGLDVYTAHVKSELTGWSIGLGIPAAAVDAGARQTAWLMGGGILGAITLALLLAAWLGRRISQPVVTLAAAARAAGRGEPAAPKEWERISELREVGTALNEAAVMVREREASMEREKQALQEADRAKDAFIAMMSHELRNPLAAITSAGELLEQSGDDRALASHACEVINRQARHMGNLVEDLLDISRLTMGKTHLQLELLDLAAIAHSVIETWRSAGRINRYRVHLEAAAAWIRADRSRVEQILSNLLDNAVKFSPADTRVLVKTGTEHEAAFLQVEDRGPGMSPELIRDAFGLFVQGEQGLAREFGGLGVGLALVKRLTELQDGAVTVQSEPGRGTVFTIRFPAMQPPEAAGSSVARAGPAARRRVLVVEDNADFRAMLVASLSRAGHEVLQAENGETGLAIALESRPDVVLLDIGLPGMNGYDVARLLRARTGGQTVLIALSGYGQPADRQKAMAAGFDEHLTKPVAPERILEAVQSSATLRRRLAS